ncbi:hypothetical protein E2C01_095885 [Portunus trituberculatus]|uniref:Uncharacterized protein n=1 Tax=Portunus trituberculatus TaxID=210409 RepID=A0A5B7K6U1_PORTR|nr:hypothetical protein [Portunus trituberculatus]
MEGSSDYIRSVLGWCGEGHGRDWLADWRRRHRYHGDDQDNSTTAPRHVLSLMHAARESIRESRRGGG